MQETKEKVFRVIRTSDDFPRLDKTEEFTGYDAVRKINEFRRHYSEMQSANAANGASDAANDASDVDSDILTTGYPAFMSRNQFLEIYASDIVGYYCGDARPTTDCHRQTTGIRRPNCIWPENMCPGYCGGKCCAMSSLMVRTV